MQKKLYTNSYSKSRQRTDNEDRSIAYSNFHRTLDKSLLTTDVDYIEWRFIDGVMTAVAVIEVTRVDKNILVNENYFKAILDRFEKRDVQSKAALTVANALNTKAYIVLYREDCSEFWIYSLSDKVGFNKSLSPAQYEAFLKSLKNNA
jgi:hypothetical protein